ncbi:hypothetical protein [Nonomuraea roseoviolacea]|uniref:ABC transporter n=1 Tax=Nonomuraea roseoviolacea subsp. carminata TaxID=160689 RepID=A0ABT1JTF3_9ACTN|nr:hypothetical protein [Nonomuraea roseoviolacea]MCP2344875.1 hypothetical protein [Nonomuraea roseoviolacea subsp. carminata]
MRTWLRVHRAAQVCVALALTAGLVAAAGDVLVPVPRPTLDDLAGVPVALVAPLVASSVLVRGALAGGGSLEAVAVRPVLAYRTGLVALTCALSLVMAVVETVPYGAAAARNLVGFTGLAALAALWRRDAATAAPAAYLVAAMLLGRPGAGSWWDWPVEPSPHPATWVVPAACLGLGLAAPALPRLMPRRHRR